MNLFHGLRVSLFLSHFFLGFACVCGLRCVQLTSAELFAQRLPVRGCPLWQALSALGLLALPFEQTARSHCMQKETRARLNLVVAHGSDVDDVVAPQPQIHFCTTAHDVSNTGRKWFASLL